MSYRIKSPWFPTAVFLITGLGAISVDAAAVDLVTDVDGAEVQVSVAVESIVVGARTDFLVTVTPADEQPTPSRVRGRFGMPDHGHWTTDEQTYVTAPGVYSGMKFSGDFRCEVITASASGSTTPTDAPSRLRSTSRSRPTRRSNR